MWAPQPGPQTEAITATWCDELFYGGAAGGGKSDFLLGDYLQDVQTYGQAWRGILFRRTFPELEELLARAREIYPQTGATWNEQKRTWSWPNGANLKLRYCESERDVTRYQGHQYTWVGWDELTQWANLFCYRYLRSRLRSAHSVPTKRIRAAANPGGAGHLAVKAYFIDPAPMGYQPIRDADTGMERMFVPALLTDNAALLRNDPNYAGRLRGLGGQLAKAMLDGDWNVLEGAFFDCWSASRHVVRPFEIPATWARFMSGDWGSAKPFSFGWWAIVDDAFITPCGVTLPRGCIVRYREWYGSTGEPNEGLKIPAEQVGRGLVERMGGVFAPDGKIATRPTERLTYGRLDPAAFASDGGPSIAERLHRGADHVIAFTRADNARVSGRGAMGGWDQMRARLMGDEDGLPMIATFSTCLDSIRTIPALQHDRNRPEDVDTDGEDHAGDDWRYACMSRPWAKQPKQPDKPRDRYARKPRSASGWAA
ncbi:hypothetical protein [Methylocaldum sp.]|uniref:hypothetical protein n=1 Tax=Methylocaldum sp. TaxID=1969727 RepID=UPI002D3DB71B|nr:hypothetical protein [Methylocaldum sp.]HYE38216.1 hypothetical protein [Methylocaldum sp.]